MGARRGFMTDLPMQPSGAQMNRGASGIPQTYSFVYMSDHSIDMIKGKVDHTSVMKRMAPGNPQPDPFIHMDNSSMNLKPQSLAGRTMWKKHQKRTSFMHTQHEELEALFSHTMFPDKNLQKELALKFNLPESAIKTWFRNRRVKLRKQQQQQLSVKQPSQILPAQNMLTSPTTSTSPYSSFPVLSGFYSSVPPHPLGPSSWAWDSIITESPISDVQMQGPQLEMLVASVPALYADAYDIAQIMKLYSFPDEDELSDSSFHCLYQYLSPTGPS